MLKKRLLEGLALIISVLLFLGFWACGFFIQKDLNLEEIFGNWGALVACVLLIILAIANVKRGSNMRKQFSAGSLSKRYEIVEKLKEEIESDYEGAEKAIYKKIICFTIYKITLLFLLGSLALAIGLIGDSEAAIAFGLLVVYANWGILNSIFPTHDTTGPVPKDLILTKEEFPVIHSIITKASETANYQGKITLVISSNGISIANNGLGVIIALQPEEIALQNEEELYSIMLHEFAHRKNNDLHRRKLFVSFVEKAGELSNASVQNVGFLLFLSGFAQKIAFNVMTFEMVSSRKKEQEADNFVKEQHCEKEYINATAKSCLFTLYSQHPWKEITFDTYSENEPVKDYSFRNYNCFLQKVALYGDKWHFTLKNELPARVDSHPTFAMRMEAMGITEYNADFSRKEGNYYNEQEKLLEKSSLLMLKQFEDRKINQYQFMKKSAYDERVDAMKKYDAYYNNWGSLTDAELIECAQAFLFIDDKKAEKILLEVIARSNSSFACYLLGCLYAREYNDECIELFKKAAIDPTATDEAFNQLGQYALKTGNQKLLDEYRANVVGKNELAEEENVATLFTKDGLSLPNETHAEQVNEIKEKMLEYWHENLNGMYVTVRETDAQTQVFYIALDINKKLKGDALQKPYDESCYLINRMSQAGVKFYLFFTGAEYNAIKKINGSCIYKKEEK